jgi:hypothetical protein
MFRNSDNTSRCKVIWISPTDQYRIYDNPEKKNITLNHILTDGKGELINRHSFIIDYPVLPQVINALLLHSKGDKDAGLQINGKG